VDTRNVRTHQYGVGNSDLVFSQTWSRDDIRYANVFIVDEKRVTEVALVLTEGFAMIAKKNEERVPIPQRGHPSE